MSLDVTATAAQPEEAAAAAAAAAGRVHGGRFDFDDGGTYCGGWEDGKAHGHGVCTGPKGQGEYSGSWHYGFEVSGIYTWPSGSTYEGHWQNGRRHGLGIESRGRWTYKGEWTQGFKGRYGVRQSGLSSAKYEGTWSNGLQDGYGSETYADSGVYQGQWQRGFRHGYGVRTSAPFGVASAPKTAKCVESSGAGAIGASSRCSDGTEPGAERDRRMDELRGGFVLRSRSEELPQRRGSLGERPAAVRTNLLQGLRLRKQRSTGDLDKRGTAASVRSTASSVSWMSSESRGTNDTAHTDSNASFVVEDEQMDSNVTETYMGEWKNDRRAGYGVCERSDGLRYEGEWYSNKKYGYGVTIFRDGSREQGKYKNNVLVTSNKKKHMFLIRSAKFRDRIEAAVQAAIRASKISLQKADIAISRTATARGKAEQAEIAAQHSREDCDIARLHAKQFAPDFHQPGSDNLRARSEIRAPSTYETTHSTGNSDLAGRRSSHLLRAASVDSPNGQPPNMAPPLANFAPPLTTANVPPSAIARRNSALMAPPLANTTPPPANTTPPLANTITSSSSVTRRGSALMASSSRRPSHLLPANNVNHSGHRLDTHDDTPDAAMMMSSSSSSCGRAPAFSRAASVDRGPGRTWRESSTAALSDRFSQYSRPPSSRDGSVERYGGGSSRHTPLPPHGGATAAADMTEVDRVRGRSSSRAPSQMRSEAVPSAAAAAGTNSRPASRRRQLSGVRDSCDRLPTAAAAAAAAPATASEAGCVKRSESLFLSGRPAKRGATPGEANSSLHRKKSLPDADALPPLLLHRREACELANQRRLQLRRQLQLSELYRANPLLYIFNPDVKEWFSRQRLVIAVILVNVSMAMLFIKLMT